MKKPFLLYLLPFILLLYKPLFSQTDSLEYEKWMALGKKYHPTNIDSSLLSFQEATRIAKESSREDWNILANLQIAHLFARYKRYEESDSIFNLQAAKRPYMEAHPRILETYLNLKANSKSIAFQFEEALTYFEECLPLQETIGDSVQLLLDISQCYNRLSRKQEALDVLKTVEDHLDLVEAPFTVFNFYYVLAGLYKNMEDYEASRLYLHKSLAVEGVKENMRVNAYYALGTYFPTSSKGENADSGFFYLRKVIQSGQNASAVAKAYAYGGMVVLFSGLGIIDSAEYYFRLYEEAGKPFKIEQQSGYFMRKGSIAKAKKEWLKAKEYYEEASAIYLESENIAPDYYASILVKINRAKIGNLGSDEVLVSFDSLISNLEQFRKNALAEEIEKWRISYETEEIENQAKLLEKDVALKEASLSRQRIAIWLIALILLIAAGSAVLLFRQKRRIESANQKLGLLYKELQHRTKNYLQTVGALFTLQSAGIRDEGARQALEEGRRRVDAMKLLEQRLLREQQAASVIRIRPYLDELSQSIAHSLGSYPGLRIEQDIQDIELDVEKAMSIGIIVNELITNASKHGLSDTSNPRVWLSLQKGDKIRLVVEDNGKGLPGEFNLEKTESFGLKIVKLFSEKINARLSFQNNPGARFEIEF
jgi:two-component sensor histidine kinase/tetratricopeptide (TPR) repeat protein